MISESQSFGLTVDCLFALYDGKRKLEVTTEADFPRSENDFAFTVSILETKKKTEKIAI